MRDELIIRSLDRFGLTKYEAMTYLALMNRKNLKAGDVADLSGVPRSRVYDNLRLLELKGLCQVVSGKTKLYSAVDPSQLKDVLIKLKRERINYKQEKFEADIERQRENFKLEIQKEKDRLVEYIKEAENLVEKLSPVYAESRANEKDIDYIEIFKDTELAHAKTCELLLNVKFEILGFTKPPYLASEKRLEQINYNNIALNKGVVIKNIYEIPKDKHAIKSLIDEIEYSRSNGELSKVAEFLPTRLGIIDEETVIYSLNDPLMINASVTASIVKHKNLAKLVKIAFETMWDKANDPEVLKEMI